MPVLSQDTERVGGGISAVYQAGFAIGSFFAGTVESFGRAFKDYDPSWTP